MFRVDILHFIRRLNTSVIFNIFNILKKKEKKKLGTIVIYLLDIYFLFSQVFCNILLIFSS